MAKVVKRSVLPIYAVAVVWLIFGLFLPFYRPLHYVAAVLVSLVVFLIAKALCPDRTFETPEPEKKAKAEPAQEKPASTGAPELDALIQERDRAVSEMHRLNDAIADPTISAQIEDAPHMTLLIVIFLAPFVEEVLFRGLVFGNLRRKSAAVGYLVSCLLFALLHVWQFAVVNRDITYFLLMLQYLVPGLVLAWVYDRTGTLWTSIGLHAAANALSAWTLVA